LLNADCFNIADIIGPTIKRNRGVVLFDNLDRVLCTALFATTCLRGMYEIFFYTLQEEAASIPDLLKLLVFCVYILAYRQTAISLPLLHMYVLG